MGSQGEKLVVAVTGASGFVGRALVEKLGANSAIDCRACLRTRSDLPMDGVTAFILGAVETADWTEALAGADVVVHTVARTHVLDERDADPMAAYRRVNVTGTRRLAEAAAKAGVKRLIFLSSIKVNGEATPIDRPFTAADAPRPEDAYGISKWEAEQALWAICTATGLEGVVLRPPLVYGPGVKGNLRQLMKLVARGLPLPLGSVRNKRSLIGVGNLVGAIEACLQNPAAAGRTFLVSDGNDLSTPELVEAMARAMGVPARLWPFPPALLAAAATVLGRSGMTDRLLGSLRVDARDITTALGWSPQVAIADELARMANTR